MKKFIKGMCLFIFAFVVTLSTFAVGKADVKAANGVCEMNGVSYNSIQEAIDAADAGKKTVIKVTQDIADAGHISIENKAITLDIAGHSVIYRPSEETYSMITISGDLDKTITIKDSVGSGYIESGYSYWGMIAVRKGNVIFDKITLKQMANNKALNQYGIYATAGNITINNCNVTARFPLYITNKFPQMGDLTCKVNGGRYIGETNSVFFGGNMEINGGYFSSASTEAAAINILDYVDMPTTMVINSGEFHGVNYAIQIYYDDESKIDDLKHIFSNDCEVNDYTDYDSRETSVRSAEDIYCNKKPSPAASMFDCKVTAKKIYDGKPTIAVVTLKKPVDGLGNYKVYYVNTATRKKLTEAPSAIGQYDVYVEVERGSIYIPGICKVGSFSIEAKLEIKPEIKPETKPETKPEAKPNQQVKKSKPKTIKVGKATYVITSKAKKTVSLVKVNSAKAKSFTIPAKIKKGKVTYKVTGIKVKAFTKCKRLKTLIIKTKLLKKTTVKKSLAGSKIKTVKVPASKIKAYKKIFAKANSGKKVIVKKL